MEGTVNCSSRDLRAGLGGGLTTGLAIDLIEALAAELGIDTFLVLGSGETCVLGEIAGLAAAAFFAGDLAGALAAGLDAGLVDGFEAGLAGDLASGLAGDLASGLAGDLASGLAGDLAAGLSVALVFGDFAAGAGFLATGFLPTGFAAADLADFTALFKGALALLTLLFAGLLVAALTGALAGLASLAVGLLDPLPLLAADFAALTGAFDLAGFVFTS